MFPDTLPVFQRDRQPSGRTAGLNIERDPHVELYSPQHDNLGEQVKLSVSSFTFHLPRRLETQKEDTG